MLIFVNFLSFGSDVKPTSLEEHRNKVLNNNLSFEVRIEAMKDFQNFCDDAGWNKGSCRARLYRTMHEVIMDDKNYRNGPILSIALEIIDDVT